MTEGESSTCPRPPVIVFCQVAYGVGHWVRTAALLSALLRRFDVTLLMGGRFAEELRVPAGVRTVQLPVKFRGHDDRMVGLDTESSLGEINRERVQIIPKIVARVRPVAVIVEYFPFGRWEIWNDVLQLVEAAKYPLIRRPKPVPLVLCSLRDIRQTKRPYQEYFDAKACEMANSLFDGVLVHSDPAVTRFEETFLAAKDLRIPVFHTGYAVPEEEPTPTKQVRREKLILVSAGGGLGGEALLQRTIEAQAHTGLANEFRMRVIGGVFQPSHIWERLKQLALGVERLELVRWVPNLRAELVKAAVSVSRCGYNTSLDVLRTGTPALFVPYATPHEDEQTTRAKKLESLGAARYLPEDQTSPERLASEIRDTAAFRPTDVQLDMAGATRSTNLLAELLARDLYLDSAHDGAYTDT